MKNFLRFAAVAVALALPALGVVYDEVLASNPTSTCSLEKNRNEKMKAKDKDKAKKPCPGKTAAAYLSAELSAGQRRLFASASFLNS